MIYNVTYVENGTKFSERVVESRMKTFVRILERQSDVTAITVSHRHLNVIEIGMVGHYGNSEDCGYGCKILKCETCGAVFESHNSTYGCQKGQ